MTTLLVSPPARSFLWRITPFEWAGLGSCAVLGLALGGVWRGDLIEPISWLVWITAACLLSVLALWAWQGRKLPTAVYAVLCAVPATFMATVTGGLSGAGLLSLLWPVLFLAAARLPIASGLAATVAGAIAAVLIGTTTGPLASNAFELPSLAATNWVGAIGLSLCGLYLAALVVDPIALAGRHLVKSLTQRLSAAETAAALAANDAQAARDDAANKARFMAEMSHEIRNPLTAILGFSETMREGVMGPMPRPYQDYPRLIHDSGRHLLDLVSDLLDLSKIEAGRYAVGRDRVNLDQIAAQSLDMMAGAATRAKVRLRLRASGPIDAVGDTKALRQCMLNLISNAIKFTPEGGQIQIGAQLSDDQQHAILEVRDTGVGMDASQLARATELYASAGDQPRGARGTGLGLALVQQLVTLQGGRLDLTSTVGQGTVARIVLPTDPLNEKPIATIV